MVGKKTGGREKGTPNKPKLNVDEFIARVEKALGRTLEDLVASCVTNPRSKTVVALRLLEYKLGRPKENVEVSGGVKEYVRIIQEARERVHKAYAEEAARKATAEPAPDPTLERDHKGYQELRVDDKLPIKPKVQ
jgi:hypothetical protein